MIKQTTHATKKKEQQANWYLVDFDGKTLGRTTTEIARILMGKNKPNYVPYMDMGDHVIVINAAKVHVSGNKVTDKLYRHHSGFPGGFHEFTFAQMLKRKPTEIVRKAVWGMMPKTRLGRKMMSKLHIFAGSEHKYHQEKIVNLDL